METTKKSSESYTEFYQRMHQSYHSKLWNYCDIISRNDSEISKIEITSDGIWAKLKNRNIWIPLVKNDPGTSVLASLNNRGYEKEDSGIIYKCLDHLEQKSFNKKLTIIDIGANIGWYTMNLIDRYSNSRVIAFEPNPRIYKLLKLSINRNNLSNRVQVENMALYNTTTKILFHLAELSGASGITKNLDNTNYESVYVEATSLDMYCQAKQIEPDFIKIDAEGAELFILQGASKIIQDNATKPVIFCELLRKWSKNNGYQPNDVIKLLNKYNYNCFEVFNSNQLKSIESITEITANTNFMFLHESTAAGDLQSMIHK